MTLIELPTVGVMNSAPTPESALNSALAKSLIARISCACSVSVTGAESSIRLLTPFRTQCRVTSTNESFGLCSVRSVTQLLLNAPCVRPTEGRTRRWASEARTTPHSCTTSLPPPPPPVGGEIGTGKNWAAPPESNTNGSPLSMASTSRWTNPFAAVSLRNSSSYARGAGSPTCHTASAGSLNII